MSALEARGPEELRPSYFRRQRHQDRLDIAAGHQAELGAAVVQQVELDVAPAPHELVLALGCGPRLVHVLPHQPRIDVEEGLADATREGEVAGEVAAVEVVNIPGVNHLMVPATTGEVAEYATLKDKQISAAVASATVAWLQKTLPAPRR